MTDPAAQVPPLRPWRETARRGLTFLKGERRRSGLLVALTLVAAAFNALEPLLLKAVVDALTGAAAARVLLLGVVALLLVAVLREAAGAGVNWLTWRIRLAVNHHLMEEVLRKVHALSLDFHREVGVGGLLTRLDRSITGFLQALQELLTQVVPGAFYLLLSILVMARLDWRLTLVVVAFTPLPPLVGMWAAPEQVRRESLLLERWVRLYSRFNEVLTGIVTVRSFVMEDIERRRFLAGVRHANRIVLHGVGRDSAVGGARNVIAALARVTALGYGGWLTLQGEITVGTLVAFLTYVGGLFGPVQGLTNAYQTLRRATVSLNALFDILDREETLADPADGIDLEHVRGDVRFERVRFGYRPSRPLLDGIDLDVRAGETLALVGPSGSGKSTLMALLQRLYDPQEGRILVDGHDLRTLRQKSLRRHLGVVLQDALLFDDPVRDNIAYGRPGASLDQIVAAARASNADRFIRTLPQGYDTPVGERGSRLSVGERQRIAIARALLKDPAILILDEPTAALDAESEALVQEALERLMAGRTTFVIAHRLVTVVGADRIVVLREGRIVETGTHAELLRAGGYYASLVARQVRGLLPTGSPGGGGSGGQPPLV